MDGSDIEQDVEAIARRDYLELMFESYLTERERKILYLYYGLDDGEERTLEEIGSLLGVTRERIRQIRNRAFEKLRESPHGDSLSGVLGRQLEKQHLDTRADEAPPVNTDGAFFSGTALRRSRYHSSMAPPKYSTRHCSKSGARLYPAGCPLLLPFLAFLMLPATGHAQVGEGWDDPRALELVERARAVRQSAAVDPDLTAYRAIATGHVFFLVDRPSSGERTLVKADQLAIEIFWRAPRDTRQRIVGMRDQKVPAHQHPLPPGPSHRCPRRTSTT